MLLVLHATLDSGEKKRANNTKKILLREGQASPGEKEVGTGKEAPMSGKRVLAQANQHEHMTAFQPIPMDGSGKPPNKGIFTDQIPRLPYCVLVIDESPMVCRMVRVCLEREGMLVFDFSDGTQALQWLEEKICKPHVVLLNADVSEASWSPLIHHLRAQTAYASTAIVALSRNKGAPGLLQAYLIGVQGFLIKPFHAQDLLHVIQRSLRLSRTR